MLHGHTLRGLESLISMTYFLTPAFCPRAQSTLFCRCTMGTIFRISSTEKSKLWQIHYRHANYSADYEAQIFWTWIYDLGPTPMLFRSVCIKTVISVIRGNKKCCTLCTVLTQETCRCNRIPHTVLYCTCGNLSL